MSVLGEGFHHGTKPKIGEWAKRGLGSRGPPFPTQPFLVVAKEVNLKCCLCLTTGSWIVLPLSCNTLVNYQITHPSPWCRQVTPIGACG